MAFDFYETIFDEDGECEDGAFDAYVEGLMDAFAASPEGQALDDIGWLEMVSDYARSHFSVTLASLESQDFGEIMWEIFPRKVSCDPADGPAIVRELRAFWTFAGREFAHPESAACLAMVGEGAEATMEEYLGDASRHGMAKSFFMAGKSAGFDVHSREGIAAWSTAYNEAFALPRAENNKVTVDPRRDAERKAKRKREKAARKKARR